MLLKTDYQDDILDLTQNANRKFNEVTNQDGSKSFEDVTEYEQEGTPFGAQDVNAITKALTDETHGVSFQFGIDGNGDYGYIKDGETAVTPFRNRHTETYKPTVRANNNDMGLYHKKRYVDTTAVPNTNSGTKTISDVYTSGNGLDLGATNSVRYIKTSGLMKTPTATKTITANGNNQDVLGYATVDVNVSTPPYTGNYSYTEASGGVRDTLSVSVTNGGTYALTRYVYGASDYSPYWNGGISGGSILYNTGVKGLDGQSFQTVIIKATGNTLTWGGGTDGSRYTKIWAIRIA